MMSRSASLDAIEVPLELALTFHRLTSPSSPPPLEPLLFMRLHTPSPQLMPLPSLLSLLFLRASEFLPTLVCAIFSSIGDRN